jgi:CDP-diacylglycerol--serine O-phosphatidyltransferase
LARFNTQAGSADKRYFQGLASPAAAVLLAGVIWVGDGYRLADHFLTVPVAFCITVAGALLMVSNIRYYSFKELDLRGRVPFVAVLAIVLGFVLISLEPAVVLLTGSACYALSGPVWTLSQLRRRRAERRRATLADRDAA